MKKILIFAVLAMLAVSASAQKNFTPELVVDKVEKERRSVITNEANLRDRWPQGTPILATLGLIAREESRIYLLSIKLPELHAFALPKGGVMLIKLNSGDVIELEQSLDEVDSKDYVGKYDSTTKIRLHYNRGNYRIKRSQLEAIAQHGVAQVRIEKTNEYVDLEYKKEKWQPVVAGWLGVIDEALAQKKDIYSDF